MKRVYYKYLLIILFFWLITFLYSFYIYPIDNDEIWNYGFAHNIYTGLIPYKDFNMIVPPLFAFCTLPFFALFGDSLLSFHCFSALITGLLMLSIYMKIGKKAFLVFPIIMLCYLPWYNLFCVFLFIILTHVNDSKIKNKDIWLGIIVGLIFLTKQTIGLCLFVPCLFYSKKKYKTIVGFISPILIFTVYLFINNAFFKFIDYCFLGMFSFASDNGNITIYMVITLLLSIFFVYKLIKSKFKLSNYFYAVMFQIMVLPIGDYLHFYLALSVLVYVFLMNYEISFIKYIYLLIFLYCVVFLIDYIKIKNNIELNPYATTGYYYGRSVRSNVYTYLDSYSECLNYANEIGYDNLFVFSKDAYFLKLANNQVLNKFDLINDGNMGYRSYVGYIEDIESMCEEESCIFIVERDGDKIKAQTNHNLLNYPRENYTLKKNCLMFEMYKNENY